VTTPSWGASLAPASPPSGSPADVAALRAALAGAGFTGPRVCELLHVDGDVLSVGPELAVHERRLAGAGPPLPGFVRLFVLGLDTDEKEVAPVDAELLLRLGLAEDVDGLLCPLLRIIPHDDLCIAADLATRKEPDHVAGVHRPSGTLDALTVRRDVRTALDVGTGCGVQALLAARHAERVVATDVNERALAFAAFSVALNGVRNVEFRHGSFFEPVRGERFGLVVSNPPYVVSPETALLFRDGGKPGDAVSADLVAELPDHLDEGGYGSIMVSWIAGDDPAARPASWLADRGCDAWIFHSGTEDALTAAGVWNRAAGTETDGYAERVDAWLHYYEELGVERIGYGTIVARRRSGARNWIRSVELPGERVRPASEHLQRMFTAQDLLAAAPDTPLERALVVAPAAFVDRTMQLVDGDWTLASAAVRLEEGLGFGANLDAYGAVLVAALDGSGPLGPRLAEIAEGLGAPEAEFREFAARVARHLLEFGIVVPAP